MSRLVFASTPDEAVLMEAWAVERIPHMHGGSFGPCVTAAVIQDDAVVGVVAFYNWHPEYRTMQVSGIGATRLWLRPHIVAAIFDYAFRQAGAYLLWVGTPAGNEPLRRFLKRIGFRQDPTLRHRYGPKRHSDMFSMTAGEWAKARRRKGTP